MTKLPELYVPKVDTVLVEPNLHHGVLMATLISLREVSQPPIVNNAGVDTIAKVSKSLFLVQGACTVTLAPLSPHYKQKKVTLLPSAQTSNMSALVEHIMIRSHRRHVRHAKLDTTVTRPS
jgi:hypothetical protein